MSVPLDEALFQTGTIEQRYFSKDCEAGDTEIFDIAFPTPFPSSDVRVILTPNNLHVPRGEHNAALVGMAQKVTPTNFVLRSRNSDCAQGGGYAGWNWLAVLETPGTKQQPPNLRMGIVQPKSFSPDCETGDTKSWGVSFSSSLDPRPVVLVTASNLGVRGHNAAVVGTVIDPDASGFTLRGRNSDSAPGGCGFYFVALSHKTAGQPSLIVDTGGVPGRNFYDDGSEGDTQEWDVYFHRPFLTPPTVLVTANDYGLKRDHNAAAVGMVRNVTPYGFTLVGRNSDCFHGDGGIIARGKTPSKAGFYWVAIGCGLGCG